MPPHPTISSLSLNFSSSQSSLRPPTSSCSLIAPPPNLDPNVSHVQHHPLPCYRHAQSTMFEVGRNDIVGVMVTIHTLFTVMKNAK
ncbi:hypothetical protein GLYMA_08G317900v4 [Glycine max]|uniref:Uncharacterized protein n=1 Tax=Glycine max TaxID=3847 RepID=A0A0R0J1Q8_SOYBN|nr:hypothetical protein GLYMA_08G317900v4 [Glycine max]KAH1054101.1 hypothetical protein GYH30_023057 [Glycine max]KAH1054102.1 hypothetical protein GYH30_023057 [Glycine max]KRH46197.1 hypothetical protein GLYMA_08G317900v4 [Glycine max]